jgi:Putative capsular polysaccharide synthesis protein
MQTDVGRRRTWQRAVTVFQTFLRQRFRGFWKRTGDFLSQYTTATHGKVNESDHRNHLLFVYQMGRVGSNSIKQSLEHAYKSLSINTPVLHGHYLANFETVEKRARLDLQEPGPFMHDLITVEQTVRQSMAKMSEHHRLKLISLVRDPVARNVSTFFFALNAFSPQWKQRFAEDSINPAEWHQMFLAKRAYVLTALHWFEEQMEPVFDIDVYATPFPIEKGYQIYSSAKADLLLLRLESLEQCAQEAFLEFLGLHNFKLLKTNTGDNRATGTLYRLFKTQPLTREYVEWTYSFRLARHFYTEEELERFTVAWTSTVSEH